MIGDDVLAKLVYAQNLEFFSGLAPAVRAAGIDSREPFLDLGASFAFFAGDGSPLTQAGGMLSGGHLDRIREFFAGRATSWEAVVTPFASPGALQHLIDLGGSVMGWESSLFRAHSEPLPEWEAESEIEVVEVEPANCRLWADVSQCAFFGEEPNEVASTMMRLFERTDVIRRYLAYWDGEPAGAASLTPGHDVAFLGGMATLPSFRGRGIQMAMLRRRLEDAREYGGHATMGAEPGSASHRNALRVGFRLAYTQLSLRVPT